MFLNEYTIEMEEAKPHNHLWWEIGFDIIICNVVLYKNIVTSNKLGPESKYEMDGLQHEAQAVSRSD